ncbi:MAG: hypothetical protein IJ877_05515 [Candidatus Gastranaerophilales bacterium]|nr:hypothetical protein [Candidatus Gastranaerophilales bacterium]
MGLDGISINQLRVTPEFNSAELNATASINQNDTKIVDGLSNGQRVDPDKESEKDNSNQEFQSNEDEEETEPEEEEPVTKYDLSDSSKFVVKLDEDSNRILILEKSSKHIIQSIDADQLSKIVMYSPNSCGSIVNKKF